MILLGVDPGSTTGWCLYDSDRRAVIVSGEFQNWRIPFSVMLSGAEQVAIETPIPAHAGIYPQTVECAYTTGRLVHELERHFSPDRVHELTRLVVRKTLQSQVHGVMHVRDDATVWGALKLMHGDDCHKKGGALYGVKAHGRAALACAVALANGATRVPSHSEAETAPPAVAGSTDRREPPLPVEVANLRSASDRPNLRP